MYLQYSKFHNETAASPRVCETHPPGSRSVAIEHVLSRSASGPEAESDRIGVTADDAHAAHRRMIAAGRIWRQIDERIGLDPHRPIEKLSARNLAILRKKIGTLAPEEQRYFTKVMAQPWFVTQFCNSSRVLDPAASHVILKSLERRLADSAGSDSATNASSEEIDDFAGTDFVYMCLEVGETPKKTRTRVAPHSTVRTDIVRTRLEQPAFRHAMSWHGDIYDGLRASRRLPLGQRDRRTINAHLQRFESELVNDDNGFARTTFYGPEAIKEGTTLQVILDSRNIPEPKRTELLAASTSGELNALISGLSRTQVMVPNECRLSQYQMYRPQTA